jgi:hypothetical protein
MAARGSFSMKTLAVDRHSDHTLGPIVFILGMNIARYKDMPHGISFSEIGNSKWPQKGFFSSYLTLKMTHLSPHHHYGYRMSPIVFILSVKYYNMPYGLSLAKIGNSKWLPVCCLSMKTMHIYICSRFYKHLRILLRVNGKSKVPLNNQK